jgi:hypothetical protein
MSWTDIICSLQGHCGINWVDICIVAGAILLYVSWKLRRDDHA